MDVLTKERTETAKRVAKLNKEAKHERVRKEELELERELYELKRPNIFDWLRKLFRKGGNQNG